VFWATHLIDEVNDADHVVVLHEGRLAAMGSVLDVVRASGTKDISAAFSRLSGLEGKREEEMAR
jgi:ABC-2 type transport system ATP-binding protein